MKSTVALFALPLVLWSCHEASVKPGINADFLNPDLDVESMIARFETESREIAKERVRIADAVGIRTGQSVADIGAGTGLFTGLFASRVGPGGKVYAVDVSAPFIEHLEVKIRESGMSQVQAVLCKEDSVELAEGSVDVAFICDTYHHFEYPASTMGSLHRAVRPGGSLVVIDFHRVVGERGDWVLEHIRASQDVFTAEIEAAGFQFVEEVEIEGLAENYFLRFERK